MRIDIWNRAQKHVDAGPQNQFLLERGRFFSEVVRLSPGGYSVRFQIMCSPQAVDEKIEFRIIDVRSGARVATHNIRVDQKALALADQIYLEFALEKEGDVRLCGFAERNANSTLLRHITVLSKVAGAGRDAFYFQKPAAPSLRWVRWVSIGTTGVCTASCIHCPTNKPDRRMAVGRMGMDVFEKIILELRDGGFCGEIGFGLFAEPLDDHLLEERIHFIKRLLPDVRISIATNCSHYDRNTHEGIVDLVDNIAVHVESTDADVYNHIMDPLKAARVFPRVESLIETARDLGKNNVTLTTPVHRGNIASFDRLAEFFGCEQTDFTSLSNRAWNSGPFEQLALAPVAVCCKPDRLNDEIFIDWDGTMLPCCIDFSKSMPLGNLKTQTFAEIFASEAWALLSETFRRGEWSSQKACSVCKSDHPDAVAAIIGKLSPVQSRNSFEYEPWRFRREASTRGEIFRFGEPLHYDVELRDGIVVYGPYANLPQGRYRLIQRVTPAENAGGGHIELEVVCDSVPLIATGKFALAAFGSEGICLDFDHAGAGLLEFRILKFGAVAFRHSGATVVRLPDAKELGSLSNGDTLLEDQIAIQKLAAVKFSVAKRAALGKSQEAELEAGGLAKPYHGLSRDHSNGIVVYGPYMTLPKGRYRILHHLQLTSAHFPDGALALDVARDGRQIAFRSFDARGAANDALQLAFDHNGFGSLEFRIHKKGDVGFRHFGATLARETPADGEPAPLTAPGVHRGAKSIGFLRRLLRG